MKYRTPFRCEKCFQVYTDREPGDEGKCKKCRGVMTKHRRPSEILEYCKTLKNIGGQLDSVEKHREFTAKAVVDLPLLAEFVEWELRERMNDNLRYDFDFGTSGDEPCCRVWTVEPLPKEESYFDPGQEFDAVFWLFLKATGREK